MSNDNNNSSSSSSSSSTMVVLTATLASATTVVLIATVQQFYNNYQEEQRRQQRLQYIKQELRRGRSNSLASNDETDSSNGGDESSSSGGDNDSTSAPVLTEASIIAYFSDFQLSYNSTVEEANKKRTTKYYELQRAAHNYDLVPAVRSYPRLRNRRETEMRRIFRYRGQNKSHRTVLSILDDPTAQLLVEARSEILRPLDYSHDESTPGVWIPEPSMLPPENLHVTIAIPWWWHTVREGNHRLSKELVARFRQGLLTEHHHAFQIELERFVLLGGKTLVALWRTVGSREAGDNFVIFDRHGEGTDPMVKLRRDIATSFSEETPWGQPPLTYSHLYYEEEKDGNAPQPPHPPPPEEEKKDDNQPIPPPPSSSSSAAAAADENRPRRKMKRRNTIEWKSPGLGDHDGFIHTALARLPLDCLSMSDVDLSHIHRLCREATATYAGHRMVINKFRFLETVGEGGESNPCVRPIFDETVQAPPRVRIGVTGEIEQDYSSRPSPTSSGTTSGGSGGGGHGHRRGASRGGGGGFGSNGALSFLVDETMVRHATIGAVPAVDSKLSLNGLFDDPSTATAIQTTVVNNTTTTPGGGGGGGGGNIESAIQLK
mmetsp:Transcript_24144/g.57090  ORF Transcript_24144/g.57090 Transcript_24144/m.57090 type:complete len:603 (+) Transcript_24144:258-2066(+)